jgi:hypothetical protein
VYQSSSSLAPSTTSASSGFSRQKNYDINDETRKFRKTNPIVAEPEPVIYPNGELDEESFKRRYPVVGQMLLDFITMTIILLYYDNTLSSWPNSDTLTLLAQKAIDIILQAHATDSRIIAEHCKFFY